MCYVWDCKLAPEKSGPNSLGACGVQSQCDRGAVLELPREEVGGIPPPTIYRRPWHYNSSTYSIPP